jgi:hypothetical protein
VTAMAGNITSKPLNKTVEAELKKLPKAPIARLRVRYRELFRNDPPKAFGPDLLRRSVAHRIQETAFGGLSMSWNGSNKLAARNGFVIALSFRLAGIQWG